MYQPIRIDQYENKTGDFEVIHEVMKIGAESRVYRSTIRGPLFLNKN